MIYFWPNGPCCTLPAPVARQQHETATRQRRDRTEVALVERQQPPCPESVSEYHHGYICQPKVKIGVLLIEPRHRAVLISSQSAHPEPPRRHVAQERPGGLDAPATPDR